MKKLEFPDVFLDKKHLQQFPCVANYMWEYVLNLVKIINGFTKKVSEKILWELALEYMKYVLKTMDLTKTFKPLRIYEDDESLIVESDACHLTCIGDEC